MGQTGQIVEQAGGKSPDSGNPLVPRLIAQVAGPVRQLLALFVIIAGWEIFSATSWSDSQSPVVETVPRVLIALAAGLVCFRACRFIRRQLEAFGELNRRLEAEQIETRKLAIVADQRSKLLSSILDHIPHMIFVKDLDDEGLVLFNRAGENLVGLSRQRLLAEAAAGILPPELKELFTVDEQQIASGQVPDLRDRKLRAPGGGGETRSFHTRRMLLPGPDAQPRYLLAISEDVTERLSALDRLRHEAAHDPLTQLPNRAFFLDRLARCIERATVNPKNRFAVLFFDLDRFKLINDSLGHSVGDLLLLETARRLVNCTRTEFKGTASEPIVSRLGGDEFTILIEDLQNIDQATNLAQAIQDALRDPFVFPGREVFTSVSIGITGSDIGYTHPEDVLRDADTAMYRAKASGRARYQVFDKSMHALALKRLDTENDLRRALANNELLLEYQPIISLENRSIAGFEALLRWKHPTRGYISPKEFVRIAEETGLIIPVGSWALAEACRQMKIWQLRYPHYANLSISVNLSRKQFHDKDLLNDIDRILHRHQINPENLCLEITETMIMENSELVTPTLQALRDRRINLHMDDFGTGYSSLSCLHRFPISALKVDRSFIRNLGSDRDYAAVVQAIVALAHNLRAKVIAEGVETDAQVVMLQTLECDFAQGHYFAKALTADEVDQALAMPPLVAAA